mmetsp:Transcript_61785/g.191338  ORF Transcript_61785/g.191338 Transcript_61785/m.191338 type:complete len:250 (+) Transcript_61785:1086-1835(+)
MVSVQQVRPRQGPQGVGHPPADQHPRGLRALTRHGGGDQDGLDTPALRPSGPHEHGLNALEEGPLGPRHQPVDLVEDDVADVRPQRDVLLVEKVAHELQRRHEDARPPLALGKRPLLVPTLKPLAHARRSPDRDGNGPLVLHMLRQETAKPPCYICHLLAKFTGRRDDQRVRGAQGPAVLATDIPRLPKRLSGTVHGLHPLEVVPADAHHRQQPLHDAPSAGLDNVAGAVGYAPGSLQMLADLQLLGAQ